MSERQSECNADHSNQKERPVSSGAAPPTSAVTEVIHELFHYELHSAFDAWRSIVDGSPRYARELFSWDAQAAVPSATEAMAVSAR
jgi:hypothetical protein